MERARRLAWEHSPREGDRQEARQEARHEGRAADRHEQQRRVLEGFDKILPFVTGAREEREEERGNPGPSGRDWTMALDLVHEAAQTVRAAEARTHELVQRAHEDVKELKTRLLAAEARADESDLRADAAETRAREAEEWLRRLHDAIVNEFFALKPGKV